MGKIDFVLAIPLIWALVIGFKKGLILELASLLALILGIWGSIHFSDYIGEKLTTIIEIPEDWLSFISFLSTFVLIVIAVFLLARLINKTLKIIALGFVNRILGSIFSLAKYSLILSFLLYFFNRINEKYALVEKDYQQDSILYQPLVSMQQPFSTLLNEFETDSLNISEKANKAKTFILE